MSQTDTTVDKYEYGDVELSEREVLTIDAAFHQVYYEEASLPTPQKIFDKFNGKFSSKTIIDRFQDPKFQKKLQTWGIEEDDGSDLLSPEQVMVANIELNFMDKRSLRTVLESMGLTTAQVTAWRRNPAYANYVQKRIEAVWGGVETEAKKTLLQAMMGGDVNAATRALEMIGKYQKNVNVNVNIESVLVRVVDIVIKHVENAEVRQAIAADIMALTGG